MTPEQALRSLDSFSHAVVVVRDRDGYPLQVATDFRVDGDRVTLEGADAGAPVTDGPAQVVFSRIRPQPGVGYDQRAYVELDGVIATGGDRWSFTPERARGWDEETLPFVELCERGVPQARRYMAALEAERGEPVRPRLAAGWRLFLATRAPFLTATLIPVGLGAAVAAFEGSFAWGLFAITIAGAICVHLGLNVANDIFDAKSGADEANVTPTMFSGGSRVLQYGLVSMRQMWALCLGFYAVAVACGLLLVALRGTGLLWLGIAGVLISWFYTAPPLKLVHRGLGEVAVAAGFGPIMTLGAYWVQTQHYAWRPFVLSLPVALLVMLILYANEIPDRTADASVGKRTLVVRLSKPAVIAGYVVSAGLAYAVIIAGAAAGVLPWTALIALLTVPLAVRVARTLDRAYDRPYELMAGLQDNVLLHLGTGALLIGGTLAGHLGG
jgi:1,4-dihydroxy-2-naphthoate octaprenyltransferase